MIPTIDEGFIGRVYRTSAYVWLIGALAWWALLGVWAAAGWTVGSAVSVALVRSLEIVIRRYFVPGYTQARGALTRFSIIKLIAIAVVLTGVVWAGKYSVLFVVAFCVGALLAQSVIVLKVIAIYLHSRMRR